MKKRMDVLLAEQKFSEINGLDDMVLIAKLLLKHLRR